MDYGTLYIHSFLQPALPNTARCAICREGEHDESNPSTYSLMECSVCSQIVHRQCIKVPVLQKLFTTRPLNLWHSYLIIVRKKNQTFCGFSFQDPGEGKINKDLPSCWECPKCYQGKDSASSVLKHILVQRSHLLWRSPLPTHHATLFLILTGSVLSSWPHLNFPRDK